MPPCRLIETVLLSRSLSVEEWWDSRHGFFLTFTVNRKMSSDSEKKLVVLMTAPNREEARTIAHTLVGERLAACCNVVGGVGSIYRWEGKVEEAGEVLVIIKTSAERFPALERRIRELHSYDVPEVLALPVETGSGPYLRWLDESL